MSDEALVDKEPEAPRPKKSHARPKRNAGAFSRAVEGVRDRFVKNPRGEWSNLTPETLLGLYAYLHETVYGVLPEELADDWYPAFSTAKKFFEQNKERFELQEFFRWVWSREKRRRARVPESDFRISWRYQFSQKLVTDYRVATKK